jgi:hypothetical protein
MPPNNISLARGRAAIFINFQNDSFGAVGILAAPFLKCPDPTLFSRYTSPP